MPAQKLLWPFTCFQSQKPSRHLQLLPHPHPRQQQDSLSPFDSNLRKMSSSPYFPTLDDHHATLLLLRLLNLVYKVWHDLVFSYLSNSFYSLLFFIVPPVPITKLPSSLNAPFFLSSLGLSLVGNTFLCPFHPALANSHLPFRIKFICHLL